MKLLDFDGFSFQKIPLIVALPLEVTTIRTSLNFAVKQIPFITVATLKFAVVRAFLYRMINHNSNSKPAH